LHVGGDFYDVLYLPDRPFVVAVGDVSGKGTSAALLMVMTRIAIHSKASYLPRPSPHEILARSSQDLYDDLARVNMFVTIFVGQYEPERQRLHYANMGHSPVVFCPACGPARLLRAEDPPLGVMPVDRPHSQVLDLQAGDLLLVATDGFCEARNTAGEMYGYDRILSLVESLTRSGASAGDVAQALRTSVAEFSAGCPQDDDQTLVALRVTGQPD
jgi:sigma-B regulation protein RsbU (phosphoserine phosphatase)